MRLRNFSLCLFWNSRFAGKPMGIRQNELRHSQMIVRARCSPVPRLHPPILNGALVSCSYFGKCQCVTFCPPRVKRSMRSRC